MIPFSPPHIDEKIIEEVANTLRSGWITTGPKTQKFEQELAKYVGVNEVVCVNAATAGLELALKWYGVGEGDEVIVPAYTYCATANVVLHVGAKPVIVDVGSDFNLMPDLIKAAITEKTKVIIPVDIGGWPCDYNSINSIVSDETITSLFNANSEEQKKLSRILVLSDAAHSLGASYHDRSVGTLSDLTVFSFHAVKNLTTAEGGAICINLPEEFNAHDIASQMRVSALHGQTVDALAKTTKGSWEYDVIEPGYKCNMPDVLAAMGLVELERYNSLILPKRKQIFEWYNEGLNTYDWAERPLSQTEESESSYHVYLLRIKGYAEPQRNKIIQHIFEKDVSVNVHFKPLPMLTIYKKLGYNIDDFPQAYANYAHEISLPVYFDLTHDQVNEVINAVVSAVESTPA